MNKETAGGKNRRSVCAVLLPLAAVLLAFSVLLNFLLAGGLLWRAGVPREKEHARDEFPVFHEIWSYGEGDLKVVRIALDTPIIRDVGRGLFGTTFDPVESVLRQVRAAANDPRVSAILLEVDSPGGQLAACDEIHAALRRFRTGREDRRLVAHVRGMAASGAYLVAVAADHVVAEPTSLIGSIGVIIQSLNWRELSEQVGVRDTTFRSGEYKDLLNPFRDVSAGEQTMLQELVDVYQRHFVDIVLAGRPVDEADLLPLADGRIMTARDALRHGLIDAVGYWPETLEQTAALFDVHQVRVVRYESARGLRALLMRSAAALHPAAWRRAAGPRLMAQWF